MIPYLWITLYKVILNVTLQEAAGYFGVFFSLLFTWNYDFSVGFLRKETHKKMPLLVLINLLANLLLNIWSCICQRERFLSKPLKTWHKTTLETERLSKHLLFHVRVWIIIANLLSSSVLIPMGGGCNHLPLPWYNNFGVNLLPLPLPCACKYVNETN